jgi:hypothetical protein
MNLHGFLEKRVATASPLGNKRSHQGKIKMRIKLLIENWKTGKFAQGKTTKKYLGGWRPRQRDPPEDYILLGIPQRQR